MAEERFPLAFEGGIPQQIYGLWVITFRMGDEMWGAAIRNPYGDKSCVELSTPSLLARLRNGGQYGSRYDASIIRTIEAVTDNAKRIVVTPRLASRLREMYDLWYTLFTKDQEFYVNWLATKDAAAAQELAQLTPKQWLDCCLWGWQETGGTV